MNFMANLMERLRQLVGSNTCWDYCVLWKLSEDQRFLEFMDCCCGGSESSLMENGGGGEDELFFPCRDVMFQHPRTTTCQLLAQLPSSHPLDGINMEILISNQPRWLNLSNISNSSVAQVTLSTKVLVPIPGGLAELFAAKQVNEDQNVIEYVVAQCSTLMEQEAMNNSSNVGAPNFSLNMNNVNELQSDPSLSDPTHLRDPLTNIKESIDTLNLPDTCETTPPDQISVPNTSMNFLQQFSYVSENKKARNDFVEEGSHDSFQTDHHQQNSFKSLSENGFEELMNNAMDMHNLHVMDHSANDQLGNEKGGSVLKHEMSRMDSVSDSYHLDEEDDPKCRRRAVKGPQSKNLMAERKRRKKLNERLYNLRSLVPNISKLDRAAILGDAIKYVQELQKEAKDLQNELERNSDDEAAGATANNVADHHNHLLHQNFPSEISEPIPGSRFGPHYDHEKTSNGFHMGTPEGLKRSYEYGNASDKAQQMEVQVEVGQLEGNDFFVKVFGEQKRGGFVRLMEALNCLGLEITNVNMTSCISLVSYVFIVKKRDSEMVQAEYVRDSLLEATRNQAGFWAEMAKASENDHQVEHPSHQHQLHTHHLTPFHTHFHHLSN